MTARITARALPALATLALVIAACGNGAATAAPTPAPVTQAPATVAPTTAPATQGAAASGDPLASFHGAQDLEGLLPDSIGGVPVIKASISGTDFMGMGGSDELQKALSDLGKTPADMSVAFGNAGASTVFVFRVNGVPASQILNAMFAAETDPATITDANFGGKAVKKVIASGEDVASYIYTTQDVVFVVTGTGMTDAQLGEVFAALP